MIGSFGAASFGSTEFLTRVVPVTGGKVAVLGELSSHGGTIVSTNQDGTLKVANTAVAVSGALHACPITGHGTTPITPVTVKSYHNGKLIVTEGAFAGCGAIIQPIDRGVTVE